MRHYTKIELECYLNNRMSMLSRLNCTRHLKKCDQCRQLLDEIKTDEEMLENIRKGLKLIDSVPPDKNTLKS